MTELLEPSHDSIIRAARLLRDGGLVAFPTETVYGLGANALDGRAVARIFEAKGRPQFNPLIVHFRNAGAAFEHVRVNDLAREIAENFLPGALTMILPRKKDCRISELASAGLDTLAVRVPGHVLAHDLLTEAGIPVAAPSANRSGHISPTSARDVEESLGDRIDLILAGGNCEIGLESTVIDLSSNAPVILRPGAVSAEDIERATGASVTYDFGMHDKPRSPGQSLRHYAPGAVLRLDAVSPEPGEAMLAFGPADAGFMNLSETGNLAEAAANLFSMLRALDRDNDRIAVMPIPDRGLGVAINDRLRRAAATFT